MVLKAENQFIYSKDFWGIKEKGKLVVQPKNLSIWKKNDILQKLEHEVNNQNKYSEKKQTKKIPKANSLCKTKMKMNNMKNGL